MNALWKREFRHSIKKSALNFRFKFQFSVVDGTSFSRHFRKRRQPLEKNPQIFSLKCHTRYQSVPFAADLQQFITPIFSFVLVNAYLISTVLTTNGIVCVIYLDFVNYNEPFQWSRSPRQKPNNKIKCAYCTLISSKLTFSSSSYTSISKDNLIPLQFMKI